MIMIGSIVQMDERRSKYAATRPDGGPVDNQLPGVAGAAMMLARWRSAPAGNGGT
jgi:hypothetical protein